MIEAVSAVTLGTHEMPRAVRFYRALGFEALHGGEGSSFTSFRAGTSYLNLIAQPAERRWSWWAASSSMSAMSMHFTSARSRPDTSQPLHHAMPSGASASSTSLTPMATSLVSRGLCGPRCDQPCVKSPRFNPSALTAASGSRPHASTFSFGAVMASIIALAASGSCSATK